MKKILFTGGTSGIAYHTILRLVQKDFYIYVTSHTEEETMRMKKRFSAYSNVECFVLDVMSDEDIMKLKQLDVDVLVSSAAIGEGGALMEVPISLMEKNFRVNVFQNLKVIQTVLSRMVQKGEGRIIIMSSLAGILPVPFLGSYCATKASLISLAEILRLELQLLRKNIDVILIEPGLYHTGFNQVMMEKGIDVAKKNSSSMLELLSLIQKENRIMRWFEKDSFGSIARKIECAIVSEFPKNIYRAPYFQVMVARMYQMLKK